jgi:predicted DNA-binding transcriptional regulator AlpA
MQDLTNPDPLLNTEETAQYLNRHTKTLVNDRCNGNGPDYVRLGRQIRYKKSALDEYINKHSHSTSSGVINE